MDSLDRRYLRKKDFVVRKVAGETILVPVRNSVAGLDAIFTLNEVGGTVWALLDGRSVREIVDEVCGTYETGLEVAASDVTEFLASLDEAGLIDAVAEGD
jgi:Coenzyme PQQ synthesis protein D (PqqD)